MAGPANCIWGRRWRSAWRPPTPCPTGIPITAEERLVAGGDAPFILDLVQGEAGSRQWIEEKMAWFIPLAGAGAIDGEPWRRGEDRKSPRLNPTHSCAPRLPPPARTTPPHPPPRHPPPPPQPPPLPTPPH